MAAPLEQREPNGGKATHMARNSKKRRPWGEGEIITRGKVKSIRWPDRVLIDGVVRRKRRYLTLGVVSEREAKDRLREKLQAAGSTRIEKSNVTFAQHCKKWKADTLPTYEFSVQEDSKRIIDKILIPRFGALLVSAATPEASRFLITKGGVQEFIGELTKLDYAPYTIHHIHEVLRTVLKDAVDSYKVLETNPASGVRLPKLTPKRKKWALSLRQAAQLIHWLSGRPRAQLAVWLLIVAGLRRSEYLALRWQHVDESKAEINVSEAYVRGHLKGPKTESGYRTLPLDAFGLRLLQEWKAKSPRTKSDDFIFGTRNGKTDRPENLLYRHVYKAADALGIPRPNYLTLRRTFSTLFSSGGLAPKDLAAMMGHSEPDTQFIYVQTVNSAQRDAVNRIGEQLANLGHSSD